MTEPALPGPEGIRPEYLAAYVDGELISEMRAAIEEWLAAHPEAMEELLTQRQFAPANWPLWQQAEPPLPSEDIWAVMRERIADVLLGEPVVQPELARHRLTWIAAACAIAASLLVAWFAFRTAPEPANPVEKEVVLVPPIISHDDSLAEYAVLPIASAVEVDVQRVMGDPGNMFAVGEPPLDGPLVLATEDEVEVETVEEHPAWPGGVPVTVPTPGDAPMIFAPRPR